MSISQGDIVLVNTEPNYGEWQEAVVMEVVECVVDRTTDHVTPIQYILDGEDIAYDEHIVPVTKIVKLPKEEK